MCIHTPQHTIQKHENSKFNFPQKKDKEKLQISLVPFSIYLIHTPPTQFSLQYYSVDVSLLHNIYHICVDLKGLKM